ncbi:MAG: tyrosine-protein phosphatase [Acidimicrobiaceae bacterium]|nr:tyrosine-protein phosphatase [Acidimicrobiaceae bacterium]
MSDTMRHVAFEACFNFRDLGGYESRDGRRVRWGMLFRSDTLHRLTEADGEIFHDLGLRTVIDLRSSTELQGYGRLNVTGGEFAWHNVPMSDNLILAPRGSDEELPEPLPPGEGYFQTAQRFGGSLTLVFRLLCEGQALPAVFHCTSGKDRTGIIAALVLDILGIPDEVIASDYALTEEAQERSTTWIEANEPDFAAFLAEIPYERRAATPEKILGFLDRIRAQYGSVEVYLASLGVGSEQLDVLRDRLLGG